MVVSLANLVPLARYDGIPWAIVKIEEASDMLGPWSEIDSQVLSPIDADPRYPQVRNVTTDKALFGTGWYRVVFEDSLGDAQPPTDPVYHDPSISDATSLLNVASLVPTRTVLSSGARSNTFTDSTHPTGLQVEALIGIARKDVALVAGTDPRPGISETIETMVAYRTAMLVELTFFPEQVVRGNSPYEQYKELYDQWVGIANPAAADGGGGGDVIDDIIAGQSNKPEFSFGTDPLVGHRTVM